MEKVASLVSLSFTLYDDPKLFFFGRKKVKKSKPVWMTYPRNVWRSDGRFSDELKEKRKKERKRRKEKREIYRV